MKRMVCAVLAVVMLAAGVAWAEEDLHLLWGIEFGQDIETVEDILRNQVGIAVKYSEADYSTGHLETLRLDEDITVLGYPLDSFSWNQLTGGEREHEYATISFERRPVYELFDGAISELPLADIVHTLTEQFGPVDFATYRVYCCDTLRYGEDTNGIKVYQHIEDFDIDKLDLRSILEEWKDYYYLGNKTIEGSNFAYIDIYIGNINISFSVFDIPEDLDDYRDRFTSRYSVEVRFEDSIYLDEREDEVEIYESSGLSQTKDRGF